MIPILSKGLGSPLLILWLIFFAFTPGKSFANEVAAKEARVAAREIPIGFVGFMFRMQKPIYRPLGQSRPGPEPGFIWGDGIVNNAALGISEGLPGGMIVDYAIGTGAIHIVTTELQFIAAITAVNQTTTRDVIVIAGDFTVTPTRTLVQRNDNTLRYDIISDYIYYGTFERGWYDRARPGDSFRTITRGVTSAQNGVPLFDLGRQSGTYNDRGSGMRMIGLKLQPDPSQVGILGYFLMFGGSEFINAQNSVSKEPTNIILDRVWLEGGTTQNKGAVLFCCRNVCVRNSWIAHWWSKNSGTYSWVDVTGLLSYNSSGNIAYINNYVDASGENIFFGGGAQGIQVNQENAVCRYNYVYKDRAWYAAQVASENDVGTKCLWECKQIWKCVVEQNVFKNSYDITGGGQAGTAWNIKLQGYGGSPGHDPLSGHILFRNNMVIDFNVWIWTNGRDITQDNTMPTGPGDYLTHVHIVNNVVKNWDNNTPAPFTGPRLMMFTTVLGKVFITHNTIYSPNSPSDGKIVLFDSSLTNQINGGVEQLVVKYNVFNWGEASLSNGGIHRGASFPGIPAISNSCASYTWEYNINILRVAGTPSNQPPNNFYYQNWTDIYESADITAERFVIKSTVINRMAPDGMPIGVQDYDYLNNTLLAGVVI